MEAERTKQKPCPVKVTVDLISGKWKPNILYCLLDRTQRFGELQRQIPGISRRILTLQLRELERDQLIIRMAYSEPIKVEYALTEYGRSLVPILLTMRDWGEVYLARHEQQPVFMS
ncbi:putative HTH-type transcriptional regulator YybR [Halomicronema hongdechloris C2206]|uniref:HTH-type transcriptional regulator YybR n=1 Tax=Halomicronema hongdechloris C2206 TaxID=1641165 RepID=A0A1Z3HMT9_9CYAN|nr:putative HTH-type transcriptional regulator YybR [Halomicronema hongdechloris C2206]